MSAEKTRLDRWLWAVRIYKTRPLATEACKSGKIKIEGKTVKPSYSIKIGEIIEISKDGFNLKFEVTGLIEKRVSAEEAAKNKIDHTPPEEYSKKRDILNLAPPVRPKGLGRPTKRERREIEKWFGES